jgi:rhodanese-related sulfurtransferase
VDLTAQQLSDALPGKGFTLVNVHIPYAGELPQTDLFIPYDQIEAQSSKLPDKSAPIVLYCRSGRMSTDAAKALVKLGYTNVMELDGGMSAWESPGREPQYKQKRSRDLSRGAAVFSAASARSRRRFCPRLPHYSTVTVTLRG